jgi:glycosyltransferase involved in cell wall biosynthesis
MVSQGIPAERIVVIPNMIKAPPVMNGRDVGSYVAYAGRVSPEKGIHVLVEAARQSKGIPFQIAGSYARMPEVLHIAPENAQFLGERPPEAMPQFLSSSRFVVMTSVCFEGFPISVAEAMACGKAVICPRIGGLPEIVEDGVSGLLFEPGNAADLADKIRRLWESPELCLRMGRAGREKAIREYSPERYYARLMEAYRMAQAMNIAKVDGQ